MKGRALWLGLIMAALFAGSGAAQQPPSQPSMPPDPAVQTISQQPQAQTPTSTGAAQEGFVPVDQLPKPQDTIPAPRLVAAAYGFVWVAVFVYVWSVRKRLTTVERELQAISRRVDSGGRSS